MKSCGHKIKGNAPLKTRVRHLIADEKLATKEYRCGAKKADPKTAKLFRHIAKEEVGHKKELTQRLKEIKGKCKCR